MKTCPTTSAGIVIMVQAFEYGLVKGAAELSFGSIRIL
jgi:hypothetical protein